MLPLLAEEGACIIQWENDFYRGVWVHLLQAPVQGWALFVLGPDERGSLTSIFHKYLLNI